MQVIDKIEISTIKRREPEAPGKIYNITHHIKLSKELEDMFQAEKEIELKNELEDDIHEMMFLEYYPVLEDLLSTTALNKLDKRIKKMFEATLIEYYDKYTQASMLEVASSYFIIDTLYHFGLMPERCNLVYCYLHNINCISEDEYDRFENKEILKQINLLLELNCYFLAICYEFTKEGNDFEYAEKFDQYHYISIVFKLVENIVSLL